jgi:glycerol-3-phosphate dehydrogenase
MIAAVTTRPVPPLDSTFDLLVVGGGAFGAGAAREAALNGWSVCLCERSDLAFETSSRSSKLIHGGLRYLERFEVSLVRQALRERRVQHELAPHLVRPLPFLAPVYRGARIGPARLRAGLFLYDLLARAQTGFRRDWYDSRFAAEAEPALQLPLKL